MKPNPCLRKDLCKRHLDVLRLAPLDNDEIAETLGISRITVAHHFRNAADRLLEPGDPRERRRTKLLLVTLALQAGYITAEELVTEPGPPGGGTDTIG